MIIATLLSSVNQTCLFNMQREWEELTNVAFANHQEAMFKYEDGLISIIECGQLKSDSKEVEAYHNSAIK